VQERYRGEERKRSEEFDEDFEAKGGERGLEGSEEMEGVRSDVAGRA
jgi:hypothetical protein